MTKNHSNGKLKLFRSVSFLFYCCCYFRLYLFPVSFGLMQSRIFYVRSRWYEKYVTICRNVFAFIIFLLLAVCPTNNATSWRWPIKEDAINMKHTFFNNNKWHKWNMNITRIYMDFFQSSNNIIALFVGKNTFFNEIRRTKASKRKRNCEKSR